MNENNKKLSQEDQNQLALQAAELAVVGEVFSIIGDTLSAISAILALEVEQQEQNEKENDKKDNKNMQKQIDYLTTELEKVKKQVNRQHPHEK